MAPMVDWELAQRIAHSIARSRELTPNHEHGALKADFERFTVQAEQLVEAQTGLHSNAGRAVGRVIGREEWVDANITSFKRLLSLVSQSLTEQEQAKKKSKPEPSTQLGQSVVRLANSVASKIAAVEVGFMLGWMSTRVLGQYDLLVVESENRPDGDDSDETETDGVTGAGSDSDSDRDQDIVYYVGPNIAAMEWRHGFPADEFRLWIALHEVTHRAQFTGVPWLQQHFLSLIEKTIAPTDPKRIGAAIRQVLEDRKEGRDPFADGGLPALLAAPEQRESIDQLMGMMSLLEGHGDVIMDRAGEPHLSEIQRFRNVIDHRRGQAKGPAKLLQQLMGMEAKINQYIAGERFISAVEEAEGEAFLDHAWEGSENLPTLTEIRDPEAWMSRMRGESSNGMDDGMEDGLEDGLEDGSDDETVAASAADPAAESTEPPVVMPVAAG